MKNQTVPLLIEIIVIVQNNKNLLCSNKTNYRYDYQNGSIDFEQITQELEEIQNSAYKLYNYINQSKELKRIVESMEYGKKSLRNHLLLMVNFAINDYYKKKLVITKEKIRLTNIQENNLNDGDKKRKTCTRVAEMQLISGMSEEKTMSREQSIKKSVE